MIYLYIDTSSEYLYSALSKDNEVLSFKKSKLEHDLSAYALDEISKMFEDAKLSPDNVDKIIVVDGPGSFTGTRIGITIAKVYAWAKNIKITTTTSLYAMALSSKFDGIHVPIINARRGFVYAAIYDKDMKELLKPQHIEKEKLLKELEKYDNYKFISNNEFEDISDIEEYDPDLSKIISYTKDNKDLNPHSVNPNYLKLTAAEESKKND